MKPDPNKSPEHIVAAGILVEREDEVLLVRTDRRGWEFPGGQIEQGESILDGVINEVKEESNIVASVGQLVGVYSNLSNSRVIFDFVGSWIAGNAEVGDEMIDVRWVTKKAASVMIEHPVYSRRFQQFQEFDGRVLYLSYNNDPFEVQTEQLV